MNINNKKKKHTPRKVEFAKVAKPFKDVISTTHNFSIWKVIPLKIGEFFSPCPHEELTFQTITN